MIEIMSFEFKIIQLEDVEALLQFEEALIEKRIPDVEARMFHLWTSKARKESLEFYSKLGWSFKALHPQSQELMGFILAQPLLFVGGHTQTLWVEYVSVKIPEVRDMLIDIIYKLSREKHLQGVCFPNDLEVQSSIKVYKPELWSECPSFVSTVRR